MKPLIAMVTAVLVGASMLVGVSLASPATESASAATLSGSAFDAGQIISDANFYDGTAMNTADVQTFLNGQVSACGNTNCLRSGSFNLGSHAGDAMCSAISGGTGMSAATIITRVAAACDISPRVILTTLQKEQSLVTTKAPSSSAITYAMGYACPDTGSGCDPAYAGLGNQVYWASWQWKRYGNPTGTSKYFTWLSPGSAHAIQYSPNAACGTKSVVVQNAATAALYYYTPYTPNQAALANLYGTGDSCSAYGNRNFWRIYSEWFGSPTDTVPPIGSLDGLVAGTGAVAVRGWAIDPTTTSATKVAVTVGSTTTTITANASRPDVGAAYPASGANHGFDTDVAAAPGTQQVCVRALNVAATSSTQLGTCRTVTIASASPSGSLDQLQAGPGGVRVRGWAFDPNAPTTAIGVRLLVDGKATTVTANGARADVARAYPQAGSAHGFDTTLPLGSGTHSVCVTAVNIGAGTDTALGSCKSMRVLGSVPEGKIDSVSTTPSSLTVSGWAIDGDTTGTIAVDVYIDGVGHRTYADRSRSDLATVFPSYGAAHGFSATYAVAAGTHTVCAYAINAGAGASNPSLGCKTVTVTNHAPVGAFDSASAVAGGIAVRGWAWDQDTTATIAVHVYVDARATAVSTGGARTDVARVYPAAGSNRGFAATVAAAKGRHQVCAYGIDASGGQNTTLGCKTVTVP